MAKKKSHKKFSSSTENPFNVKVNRNKHTILGQNLKGTQGRPGVSHSLGNARRKEKFHKKRVHLQKANKFLDRRLLDSSQTYEDPATARLIQERKNKLKKSIFNLNDEENLTHKGVPLLSTNLSNHAIVDSDDDEPLDLQFIKEAHFGGFSGDSATKSRKDIIDDLIVESKKRKHERKLAREINADLIEKLDQEWKEKHATSLPFLKAGDKDKEVLDKNDPYDVLLTELKFEKRTTPSSRLKSPEEIAEEEQEKQKKVQEERNKRMNPMEYKEDTSVQVSADSIYDGLEIEFDTVTDQDNDTPYEASNENAADDGDDDSSDDSENECNDYSTEINDSKAVLGVEDASLIPSSLDIFCNIVKEHDDVYLVVENLLKNVVKNKTKRNREKLENFFIILIEYVMKLSGSPSKALGILDSILPHLYTLAEISPRSTAESLLLLLDKEQEFFQSSKGKKMKKNFPRFQCLVLFKISSKIYSVSDFRHPVVTPSITFMCDILSSPFATSYENIIFRIFVSKIIYDCVSYSGRYVPDVMFFLNKVLDLAIDKSNKFNLHVDQVVSVQEKAELSFKMPDRLCDETKVNIISEVIELLNQYAVLYTPLLSYREIFSPALCTCSKLPSNYPNFLTEEISRLKETVSNVKKTYKPLTYENKKPVPLKMFEPSYDSRFTRKKDSIEKKRKLVKSVGKKIKKEEKGMLREVRRDNQVIASEKLRERIESDVERKRKVKLLYQELSMQEGEFKKFIKKK